ncbi:hypothetical protein O181_123080 [Austropuccinia psidii MF-1]|uniref:Uncharacterized protein n=1 Tax=Austropuccinia psidii MF-1 TaxID=1389203 RepID=A0A9Q3KKI7_9BASI|nr:hypothetical protein [Austropuccinia psidii MF-1]
MVRGLWAVRRGLRSAVHGGYWRPPGLKCTPGPKFDGDPGVQGDINWPRVQDTHLYGLGPLLGSRATKIMASQKMQERPTVMNAAPMGP